MTVTVTRQSWAILKDAFVAPSGHAYCIRHCNIRDRYSFDYFDVGVTSTSSSRTILELHKDRELDDLIDLHQRKSALWVEWSLCRRGSIISTIVAPQERIKDTCSRPSHGWNVHVVQLPVHLPILSYVLCSSPTTTSDVKHLGRLRLFGWMIAISDAEIVEPCSNLDSIK